MMRLWPSQRGFGRPGRSEGASSTWQGDLGLGEAVFKADFLVNQERLVRNGCANLTRSAWVSGPQSLRVPASVWKPGSTPTLGAQLAGFRVLQDMDSRWQQCAVYLQDPGGWLSSLPDFFQHTATRQAPTKAVHVGREPSAPQPLLGSHQERGPAVSHRPVCVLRGRGPGHLGLGGGRAEDVAIAVY